MRLVIFVGPTLRPQEIVAAGSFVVEPPVRQGDVFRAAMTRPDAIGIVDGYFAGVPAVWHKEILFALAEGIPVFGAASMGALRAAELHPFGMIGVGDIFEAFRDGRLEDDDEVAVTHAPPDLGYGPTSEAMVNIRATLERARVQGVLSDEASRALEAAAKARHFPERSFDALIEMAPTCGVPPEAVATFEDWLPTGRVDLKRADALAMLATMQGCDRGPPAMPERFVWTSLWDEFVARCGPAHADKAEAVEAVLDELRLKGAPAYERVERAALLAAAIAAEGWPVVDAEAMRQAMTRFRSERGLFARADLDDWLAANAMDEVGFERLLIDEARLDALRESMGRATGRAIADELRRTGEFAELSARARHKAKVLAGAGEGRGARAPGALSLLSRRLWYFERKLQIAVPEDVNRYAKRLGFASTVHFDTVVEGEWLFCRDEWEGERA
jgi:hypothetical protein